MFPPLALNTTAIQSYDWQTDAIDRLMPLLAAQRGALLRAGTRLGKTYVAAATLRRLAEQGSLVLPEGSINPFPILWLCPKSVKIQTQRVLRDYGLSHLIMLMSYGQIKNKDGTDIFISYETITLPNGDLSITAKWFDGMLPAIVVCDESHKLKNYESLQSRVVRALPASVKTLHISATPFQRVADGRYLVECISPVTKYNMLPATPTTTPAILREIAYPKATEEYSPSATERLRIALQDYTIEMRDVKFKFRSKTICHSIMIELEEERQSYARAYAEYIAELRKRRGDFTGHGRMAKLVAMNKFIERSELLRARYLAARAVVAHNQGRCVIVGAKHTATLRSVWVHLVKKHNVEPSRIAFIVGTQSAASRQENIDNFQTGKADYILINYNAGGIGISLHHDRPTTKPRYIVIPPTWSAIDLVQVLGRAHGPTSLSATIQEILWFAGTEEERVRAIVERKVKCLSKAIIAKEQFIGLFERSNEEDDVDEETNEEYNKIVFANGDVTESEDEGSETFDGSGLDSDDTVTLPTGYR